MAYENKNLAYDLSLFEDDSSAAEVLPKKYGKKLNKNNIVKINQEQLDKVRRRRHNPVKMTLGFLGSAAAALTIGMIIFGQAEITELNQKITNAEKVLSEQQSYETQMQMQIEAKVAPSVLDRIAEDTLGMTKASNSQKEYISLSEGDKAEVLKKEEDNIFQKISDTIAELWS